MMGDGEPIQYGDPAKYINDPSIEMAWAIQTYERANIHMNLIMSVTPSTLRLNKHQDTIYKDFRQKFPTLAIEKITESELKGEAKPLWREFCEAYENLVEDYNMGSLLRIDVTKCYSDENTIIVPRMIYLAVEIARNVEGINDRSRFAFTADHQQNEAKEKAEEEQQKEQNGSSAHPSGESNEDSAHPSGESNEDSTHPSS